MENKQNIGQLALSAIQFKTTNKKILEKIMKITEEVLKPKGLWFEFLISEKGLTLKVFGQREIPVKYQIDICNEKINLRKENAHLIKELNLDKFKIALEILLQRRNKTLQEANLIVELANPLTKNHFFGTCFLPINTNATAVIFKKGDPTTSVVIEHINDCFFIVSKTDEKLPDWKTSSSRIFNYKEISLATHYINQGF